MALKTGLILPPSGEIQLDLHFWDYIVKDELPTPPAVFGSNDCLLGDMLGNDVYGDCAEAAATRLQFAFDWDGGTPASFSTGTALELYSAWTGFTETDPQTGGQWPIDPQTGEPNNPTDQGTSMEQVIDGWKSKGVIDASGKWHKIVGAVDLKPGDLNQLWVATYIFTGVMLALNLPQSAMNAAQNGNQIWDTGGDTTIIGGHAIPNFGRGICKTCQGPTKPTLGQAVSWGLPIQFTPRFYQAYSAGGVIVFSEEMLKGGKSVTGLNVAALSDDLHQLSLD
jgi:hypothetical protein